MIIRILGEGQYDVAADAIPQLNDLDRTLEEAIADSDQAAFSTALAALLDGVRSAGAQQPDDSLTESDLILPHADATIDEVRELLDEDGLIPD